MKQEAWWHLNSRRDYYIENFSAEKDKFSVIPLDLDEGEVWEGETPRGEEFRFLYLTKQGYPHLAPGI